MKDHIFPMYRFLFRTLSFALFFFLTVNIHAQNSPDAIEDNETIDEDTPLTNFSISDNDTADVGHIIDPSSIILIDTVTGDTTTYAGDTLKIENVGNYSINSSGELTFIPVLNFNGIAKIHYTIEDTADLISDTAAVTITVTPVNDAPVSSDDTSSVNENDTLIVASPGILGNDEDVDNDGLTASLVDSVSYGELIFSPDGSFVYIHNGANFAQDSFTYVAFDDSIEYGNVATMRITVNQINDPPISQDDNGYVVAEGDTLNLDAPGILSNDTDDENDLFDSISLDRDVVHGTLSLNNDGSFQYIHDGSETQIDSFIYRVSDGTNFGNQATARITITPVNDPPYFQNFEEINRDEGSDTTIIILSDYAADEDSPLEDLTYSLSLPAPTNISAYIDSDTVLYIVPVDSNWFGSEEIYIYINDNDIGGAEETMDTILVNVNNVDDPPRFTVDTIHVAPSDEDMAIDSVLLDTVIVELDGDNLVLELPSDPVFSFTNTNFHIRAIVPENWNGERYFEFYIADEGTTPQPIRDTIVLHYTINPVDDPPFVNNQISDSIVQEDADNIVYNLHNVFDDIDNTDEEMTFELNLNDNEIVEAYITEDDELILSFLKDRNSNWNNSDIDVTCTSNGKSANDRFRIYVTPVNDPPTFSITSPPGKEVIIYESGQAVHREVKVTKDPVPIDESAYVEFILSPPSVNFAEVEIDQWQGNVTIDVEAGVTTGYHQEFIIVAKDNKEDIAIDTFQLFINMQVDQEITFDSIMDKSISDSIVLLGATASSGLPVSFTIDEGHASISNDTLFILGAGKISVIASQEGDAVYNSAPDVKRTFYVYKLIQEITFEELPDRTYGDENFVLNATSSSGLDVYFSVEYGPLAIVNDTTIQINGAGEAKVVAHQDGNSTYYAADTVSRVFMVHKANQTLQFEPLADQAYSPEPIQLSASSTSGLPVTFAVLSGPAHNNGNLLYVTGVGYITIRALQSGNDFYNSAVDIDQTILVYKASQTVTFEPISDTAYGFDIDLNATISSGLPAEYSVQGPVEIKDDTVLTITGTGTAYVSAFHPGDDRYLPTDTVTRDFQIKKAIQYIVLDEPNAIIFGQKSVTISASSSSGLELNYEVLSGFATTAGNVIIPDGYGEVIFKVLQNGNENYEPASITYKITFIESLYDISVVLLYPDSINDIVLSKPTTIEARIKNVGSRDVEGFNIFYSVANEVKGNILVSESYAEQLLVGDSIDYSFSTIWRPRVSDSELKVYVQLLNDTVLTNDTSSLDLNSTSAHPYTYNKNLINNVYPNPASNFIYFAIGKYIKEGRLVIYNTSGEIIDQFDIETSASQLIFEVDVNNYRQGTYYYKFFDDLEFTTGKFVVN